MVEVCGGVFELGEGGKELSEEEKEEKSVKPVLLDSMTFLRHGNISKVEREQTDYFTTSAFATLFGRDVINTRGSVADPAYLEQVITEVVKDGKGIKKVEILRGKELSEKGLNLFYNVGKAAQSEPRLIIVHYKGNPKKKENEISIVGKGVTFDTGGINLKPTGYIEDMYCDKGGAVATLGALKGTIELQLPINAVFAFGIAENSIDSKSYKPGDILTSLKGITVEVNNTDAEGRLVLADTLTYVQKYYDPQRVVDLATLTGAAKVALGEYTGGIFANNDQFLKQFQECGENVFESHWHLPITDEHREKIKAEVGDLTNSVKPGYGGASTAAAFLESFVDKGREWIHCDIAGPAYLNGKPNPPMPKHGTGFGIQTLLELLKSMSK